MNPELQKRPTSGEKPRGERMSRLGTTGRQEREALNVNIRKAEQQRRLVESTSSSQDRRLLAKLSHENAQRERELFDESHDSTGAWKSERFGQDLRKEMDENPSRLEQSQLFIVNLGELDRLNSTGEHALGDEGLAVAFDQIEARVRAAIEQAGIVDAETGEKPEYAIYRVTGNDFMVRVSRLDRDPEKAEEKAKALAEQMTGRIRVKEGVEDAPLVADRLSWSEVVKSLKTMAAGGTEISEEDRPKVMIGLSKELMSAKNDVSKLHDRMRRFMTLENEKSPEEAKDFYEKYLQKSLGKIFATGEERKGNGLDYDRLMARIRSLGAFDPPPAKGEESRWEKVLRDAIPEEAERLVESRFVEARGVDRALANAVASQVLGKKPSARLGAIAPDRSKAVSPTTFKEPEPTRGKQVLETLDRQLTGERERSKGPLKREKRAIAKERVRQADLKLEIEKARRDTLTGLEQRGPLFERLEKGFEDDRPTTVVFIDMAFLKYFDKEGGRAAGNLALEKSAEILDTIARTFSVGGQTVEAYRVGGDEFVISIIGSSSDGTDTAEKIAAFLRIAEEEAGAIPEPPAPVGDYKATRLSFNIGVQKIENKNELRERLRSVGIELQTKPGDPGENNEIADYLIRLADKSLEIGKALNRMQYLLNLRRQFSEGESGMEEYYRSLLDYSKKALISDKAAAQIESWATRTDDEAIMREMIVFVFDALAEKDQKSKIADDSTERILDESIRRHYLDTQIAERERYLAAEESIELRAKAQADLETLQGIRKKLKKKTHEQTGPPAP